MKTKHVFPVVAICLVVAFTASPSQAVTVAVLDTGAVAVGAGGFSATTTRVITDADLGGLDLTGGSKLVVSATLKSNNFQPNQQITVTYGGVSMIPAVFGHNGVAGAAYTGIFYLDNPAAVGDLLFNVGGGTGGTAYGWAVAAMVLGNTAPGVGNTVAINPLDQSPLTNPTVGTLAGVAEGSLVLAAYGDGTPSNQTPMLNPAQFDDILLEGFGIGSLNYAQAYKLIDQDGDFIATFNSAANDRRFLVMAEFMAVPEPSTALLGLVGSVALLLRRRR